MKKIKVGAALLLVIMLIGNNPLQAKSTEFDKSDKSIPPKEQAIPTTEYDKKLEEFSKPKSKPKIQAFGHIDEQRGDYMTKEEFSILSEMKMKESERIMKENDGTKEDNEWEKSRPVGYVEGKANTLRGRAATQNWSYYLPQQWQAYGDAFVTNKNIYGAKEKNFVGHASLSGEDRSRTLETAPGDTLQWRSDRWFRPARIGVNAWTPGTQLYYAVYRNGTWAQLRVHDASNAKYYSAYSYGASKVGEPYNWTFHSSGNGFYCSELVAFAWRRGANIDIIPQKSSWNAILPMDLYKSKKTYNHRGVIY